MEVQAQVVQSFLDLRSGQEYRRYLHSFAQKTINIVQILGYLCKEKEAHPNRIAEELSITTAQMAVLLNHMEASGYIRRAPDETDRRKTIVMLTPKGREYHSALAEKYRGFISEIFDRMGQEEAAQFVTLFASFIQIGAQIYTERKQYEKQDQQPCAGAEG